MSENRPWIASTQNHLAPIRHLQLQTYFLDVGISDDVGIELSHKPGLK